MHVKVKTKGTENSAWVKKRKRILIHHLEIQFAVFAFLRFRLWQIGDYFSTLLRDVNLLIKKKKISAKPSKHYMFKMAFSAKFCIFFFNTQKYTKRN